MKSTLVPDVTPESHPHHHVVGQDLMGWSMKHGKAVRFHCLSHDAAGYNLVMRGDEEECKNISKNAVGRTFYVIHDMGDGREVSAWGAVRIDKDGIERPPYEPTAEKQETVEIAHGWTPDDAGFIPDPHPMKAGDAPSVFYQAPPTIQ